ncbi:MAG TPA: energy transducer TonB [Candidatus Acidoferrales bacterium]|nr:energy transducer TonB [Candidatus Acidoferrales bacterium]
MTSCGAQPIVSRYDNSSRLILDELNDTHVSGSLAFAACLICNLLLFAANTSAQQNKEPPASQLGGETGVPACGIRNPSPSPCVPVPRVLSTTFPTYSEQARKEKIQGSCVVGLDVDEKGNATNLRVITGLGMGLDEKAIEAVKKWKFEPALKDGKPVPAKIAVEVNFHF